MWKSVKIDTDENKKQTFAASQRPKSSGSFHIKILFKDNRYTKLANTNDKALSNDQVDKFLSTSYKKIKSSSNTVANPTNINYLSSTMAAATSYTNMLEKATNDNSLISHSSFLIINCVGICH